jgi:plastocyanin
VVHFSCSVYPVWEGNLRRLGVDTLSLNAWQVGTDGNCGFSGERESKKSCRGLQISIEMTAESFAFAPNLIQAKKGDTLLLTVRNTAGSEHNITIKDPEGKVLISRDIPSEGTVELEINLLERGKYEFFCDKPFHTTFGMKGSIEANATVW